MTHAFPKTPSHNNAPVPHHTFARYCWSKSAARRVAAAVSASSAASPGWNRKLLRPQITMARPCAVNPSISTKHRATAPAIHAGPG